MYACGQTSITLTTWQPVQLKIIRLFWGAQYVYWKISFPLLWKKSLYSDGKICHQYQQNVQPPFRKRNGTKCTTTIQEKEWRFEWCHFKPLCTKKRPRHMALEILVLAWDRHNNLSGLNWLMRSQPSSPDNWYLTSILFFFLNLVIYIHVDIIQF